MNQPRESSDGTRITGPGAPMAGDFEALKTESGRNVPSIQETAQVFHRLPQAREGILMTTMRRFRTRPLWMTAGAVAAIAIALLFVPVSYQQTLGQSVTLTLPGNLSPETADGIARTLGETGGVEGLSVMGGEQTVIQARVRGHSYAEVRGMAKAVSETLQQQGIAATAEVTPWTEAVSGNVYAFAAHSVIDIRVQVAGRSNFEIEQDIRSQLMNAGFLNPEVRFSQTGGEMQVDITGDKPDGEKFQAQLKNKVAGGPGDEAGEMEILMLDTENLKGLSDDEIKTEVERQLATRGITDAKVTVENGEIRVEACHDAEICK
jgi:hypothetical protein